MLPLKIRKRILNKLAQATPGAPASPASPTSPTAPNAPTEPSSTTGAKKSPSQPATAMMNLATGWTNWAHPLDNFIAKLDKIIIAGTNQEHNFNDLFQNKFPSGVDTAYAPPNPTGDIIRFGRQIYQWVMNNGAPFRTALPNEDMRNRIQALLNSPYLSKFAQVNMAGPLRNVSGDLNTMRSDLLALFNSIPAQ